MPDNFIKNRKIFDAVKHRLREACEEWLNGDKPFPFWMKIGKVFILSKSETSIFPDKPAIRSIMVQNMLTKMVEILIQQFMEKEDQRLNLIQPCQRGVVQRRSVQDNLLDMFVLIDKVKVKHEEYRKKKVPMKKRKATYILIIDSVKAFDNLRRELLIKDLIEMGIEPTLIAAKK
jgi:hypothetical protein